MSRYSYAGGSADFVFDVAPNGYLRLRPATLLIFAAETGGVRVTDLRVSGVAVDSIPVGETGQVPTFQGPDEFAGDLWAATGPDKPRVRLISNAESTQAETAAAAAVAAAASISAEVGLISGYLDHGSVSGAVSIDTTIGTHVLDATAATTLTLAAVDDGIIVTVLVVTGADDVTVAGIPDAELTDDTFATFARIRGTWKVGSVSSGPVVPDTTPPAAVTDLVATGGEGQVELAWSAVVDAESTVHYAYRVWLTSGGPTGAYVNTTDLSETITGLTPGAYTAQVYSFSTGGSTTPDTATATVTAPAGWNTILGDTFTDAENTALGGRTPTTSFDAATWSGSGADQAAVLSNKLGQPNTAYNPTHTINLPSGARDGISIACDYVLAQHSDSSWPVLTMRFMVPSGNDTYLQLIRPSNTLAAGHGNGLGDITLTGSGTFPPSGHVEFRCAGTTATVFVDGAEVATGSMAVTADDANAIRLGLNSFKSSTIDNLVVQALS